MSIDSIKVKPKDIFPEYSGVKRMHYTGIEYEINPRFGGFLYQVIRHPVGSDNHANIHINVVMSWHLTYQGAKNAIKIYKEVF